MLPPSISDRAARERRIHAAVSTACVIGHHAGPFDALPELAGWLGCDWCRCASCRSTITTKTAGGEA